MDNRITFFEERNEFCLTACCCLYAPIRYLILKLVFLLDYQQPLNHHLGSTNLVLVEVIEFKDDLLLKVELDPEDLRAVKGEESFMSLLGLLCLHHSGRVRIPRDHCKEVNELDDYLVGKAQ